MRIGKSDFKPGQHRRSGVAALVITVAAGMVTTTQAANLFWDKDGDTSTATGGTGGAWDTTSSLWRLDSATGALQPYSNTSGDMTANLAGSAGTITIAASTTINVNTLNVISGYTIAGGAGRFLNLDGATPTVNVTGATNGYDGATISAIVTGSGGLTKTGVSLLNLSGTNAYAGATIVSAGTLRASTAGLSSNSNLELNGGVFQSTADFTRSLGSGAGEIRITGGTSGFGSGTNGSTRIVAIGGTATPTTLTWGTTNFNPSALLLNNNSYAGSAVDLKNPIDLNGADRTITSSAAAVLSGGISGSAKLTKTGAGALTLSGNNSFSGGFTWTDANTFTLIVGSDTAFGTGLVTLNSSSGAVTVRAADGIDRVLTNDVTIDENDLKFGSAGTGSLSFGNFTKAGNGQTIQILNQKTTFASYSASGGTFAKSGTGTMIVNGSFSRTGANTFTVADGALAVGGTYSPNATTVLGSAAAAGSLGRNGSLTAALNATNGVTWATGTATGGGLFAYGSNPTWGNAGNNLTVNIGNASAALTWGSTSFVQNAQTLFLGHAVSNGTVTLQNPLNLNNAARTIRVDKGATNLAGGSDAVLAGVLSNGSLVKSGDGTLELTASNTYTGNTTVNSGTLQLSDNAVLAFVIGATGVNNKITSDGAGNNGALKLFGDFSFNLAGAGTGATDTWAIVDIGSDLTTTFGASFSVVGFTPTGAVGSRLWTGTANSTSYQFSESTGVLSVVPEPASLSILGFAGAALLRRRGRGPQK